MKTNSTIIDFCVNRAEDYLERAREFLKGSLVVIESTNDHGKDQGDREALEDGLEYTELAIRALVDVTRSQENLT